jgi:hypothetical protein
LSTIAQFLKPSPKLKYYKIYFYLTWGKRRAPEIGRVIDSYRIVGGTVKSESLEKERSEGISISSDSLSTFSHSTRSSYNTYN